MTNNALSLGFVFIVLLVSLGSKNLCRGSEQPVLASEPKSDGEMRDAKDSPPPKDTAKGDNIEALIAALRKLPTKQYFDMHGNEHNQIRALLKRRFAATDAICKEIDGNAGKDTQRYVSILYYCLGFEKDPASIPWLENKISRGDASLVYQDWLPRWTTYPRGADHSQLKWLKDNDRWAAFFRQQVKRERDTEHRLALLKALAGWFHDAETIRFFEQLESAPGTDGEILLVTQLYLHQHKCPFDSTRLAATIDKVRLQKGGDEVLVEYAKELRHEAFLPYLISLVPERRETGSLDNSSQSGVGIDDVQSTLQRITFRLDIVSRSAWQQWYEKNRSLGRQAWLQQAVAEFEALAEKEPEKARKFFDKAIYRWNDRAMLPYVQRWIKYKFLHSLLIGWINLSYHPFWRADLQPLAEKIIQASQGQLERWAEDIARDLDFLKNDEIWEKQFDWYRV